MKITLIIPVLSYDRDQDIIKTLESIPAASTLNTMIVASDPGRIDSLLERLSPDSDPDPRFFILEADQGWNGDLWTLKNYAASMVESEYLSFLRPGDTVVNYSDTWLLDGYNGEAPILFGRTIGEYPRPSDGIWSDIDLSTSLLWLILDSRILPRSSMGIIFKKSIFEHTEFSGPSELPFLLEVFSGILSGSEMSGLGSFNLDSDFTVELGFSSSDSDPEYSLYDLLREWNTDCPDATKTQELGALVWSRIGILAVEAVQAGSDFSKLSDFMRPDKKDIFLH